MSETIKFPNADGGYTSYPVSDFRFNMPPPAKWRCRLGYMTYLHVPEAPNRFHRFMQRLAFGYVWEKLPATDK